MASSGVHGGGPFQKVLDLTSTFQLNAAEIAQYGRFVIGRFYVHNFRCLENFELSIADRPSVLLIGKNGTGKTTLTRALEIL